MTYEEAIYKIKGKIGLQADCVLESDQERQVVWEALEKQIPKHTIQGRCPCCGYELDVWMWCPVCGQHLDWSEE